MKHKVKYRAEVSYVLQNSFWWNMSLDIITPSFEDQSQVSYQRAELLDITIPGKEFTLKGIQDEHKNKFYMISVNLSGYEQVFLTQIYEIIVYDMVVTENGLEGEFYVIVIIILNVEFTSYLRKTNYKKLHLIFSAI